MDAAQLVQVESLCETLYNSSDEAARSHAQNQLLSLQTSAERIPQCQYILDHSENAYALLLASSSLTRLISNHWNNFTTPQRVEIRNYILNYLGSVGASLTDYVRTSLIQLLCRITKLGWFDDQRHREVVDAVMRFLQVSVLSCCVGLFLVAPSRLSPYPLHFEIECPFSSVHSSTGIHFECWHKKAVQLLGLGGGQGSTGRTYI